MPTPTPPLGRDEHYIIPNTPYDYGLIARSLTKKTGMSHDTPA